MIIGRQPPPAQLNPQSHLSTHCLLLVCIVTLSWGCKDKPKEVPNVQVEQVRDQSKGKINNQNSEDEYYKHTLPSQEQEPNDVHQKASLLPINGGINGDLMGSAANKGKPDFDWYVLSIEGPTSQLVRIQLSPEDDTDFVLEWYPTLLVQPGETLEPLANIDTGKGGEVEVLAPTILGPGKHYFRVRRSRRKIRRKSKARHRAPEISGREYRLITTVVESEPALEREPNNQVKSSGVLPINEPRQGYLGWFGDSDWFRLDLENAPENSLIRIELSGIAHVKSRLWVVDKKNRSFLKVPEPAIAWPDGQGVQLIGIPTQINNPPLYVEVKSMRGGNALDRYTISLKVEVPEGAHEIEPNWRLSHATALKPELPVTGRIGHPTDWDVFRIDSQENKTATVTVTGVPDVDLQIELIADRRTVTTLVNENGVGQKEVLAAFPVGPLPAYVRVSSKGHSFNTNEQYQISVELSVAGTREFEPNNSYETATPMPVTPGQTIYGFMNPQKDVDFYSFTVTEKEEEARLMAVELNGVTGLRLAIRLYDSEKVLITQKRNIGPNERRKLMHEFSSGSYYLQILDESGQASNNETAYGLTIKNPSPQ